MRRKEREEREIREQMVQVEATDFASGEAPRVPRSFFVNFILDLLT